jgi:hypothetical protein
MPLKPADLLALVREGSDKVKDRLDWKLEHIVAALSILFGGAQFKEGTDLWSVVVKGMLPSPDFWLYLSRDCFHKILRYWAYAMG